MDDRDIDFLLARFLAGDAAGPEVARIREALKDRPDLLARLHAGAEQDAELYEFFRSPAVARRGPSSPPAPGSRGSRALSVRALAIAASLLAAAAVSWLVVGRRGPERPVPPPDPAVARIEAIVPLEAGAAPPQLIRPTAVGAERRPLKTGDLLRAGDRIETGRGAGVRIRHVAEATTVEAGADTALAIGGVRGAKRIVLDRGRVRADVAPQPAGRPMVFATPQAEATVVGTRLALAAGPRATLLEVDEGRVAVARAGRAESVDVAAGQFAAADAETPPEARPREADMDALARRVLEGAAGRDILTGGPRTVAAATAEHASKEARIPALAWQPRSDWFNVREVGAKGDGKTDDTDAVQKAFDRLTETGWIATLRSRVVYFPPGVYRLTRTVTIAKSHGAWVVGHGRDTVLAWDGAEDGVMYWSNGNTYGRFEGLTFDGLNKAAVGARHHSTGYYETMTRYQHCAFLNLRAHGVGVNYDAYATPSAEFWFNNCLFRSCGNGAYFHAYNDYDNIFDGCEFVDCGVGVNSLRGNFFIRTSRFIRSRVADVRQGEPSHGSSIHLCTSQGSRRFFETGNGAHQPMRISSSLIDGWTDPGGAIVLGTRGPTLLWDCSFTNPPGGAAPVQLIGGQPHLILSNNASPGTQRLVDGGTPSRILEIPPGRRGPALTDPGRRFLRDTVALPPKVFDARKDFGAAGDGSRDDTDAVQKCIDAARDCGQGALAYLPGGVYRISKTLAVTGSNYRISSTGFRGMLAWAGPGEGPIVHVHNANHVVLEHLDVHSAAARETTRILHTADEGMTSVVDYDGIYVNGIGNKVDPECLNGLWCKDLPPTATVRLGHIIGRLRLTDCGRARILCAIHYYGLVVEGARHPKTGFAGLLYHNDATHDYVTEVLDNQDLVIMDLYTEQNKRYLRCEGGGRSGPGRVTLGASKTNPERQQCIDINNYEGRIFLGGGDSVYENFKNEPLRLAHTGTRPVTLSIVGQGWWMVEPLFTFDKGMRFVGLGNIVMNKGDMPDVLPPGWQAPVVAAFDDFRELAAGYLEEFHGNGAQGARKRGGAGEASAAAEAKPARKPASPEALAAWDGRLKASVLAKLRAGKKPRFVFSTVGQPADLAALDDKGAMALNAAGSQLSFAWDQLKLDDKKALAVALAEGGEPEDAALAAFYCLACGAEGAAAPYVRRLSEHDAEAVRSAFK